MLCVLQSVQLWNQMTVLSVVELNYKRFKYIITTMYPNEIEIVLSDNQLKWKKNQNTTNNTSSAVVVEVIIMIHAIRWDLNESDAFFYVLLFFWHMTVTHIIQQIFSHQSFFTPLNKHVFNNFYLNLVLFLH